MHKPAEPNRRTRIRDILPATVVGIVAGALTVLVLLSYSALVFGGELAQYASRWTSLLLVGTAMTVTLSTILSRRGGVAAIPQDTPVAVLAAVSLGIVAAGRGVMPADRIFNTVITTIGISTLLTAVAFLVVGQIKLARLARFIPYPVIGGFLAGVGWLLLRGGIEMMAGFWPGVTQIGLFFSPAILLLWLPGLALGVLLLLLTRGLRHFLIMPLVVLGAVVLFYGVLRVFEITPGQARALGWLPARVAGRGQWFPQWHRFLDGVGWRLLLAQSGNIISLVAISLLAATLNVTGIEILSNRDMELDRELTIAGLANLAGAIAGASPSYHSVSFAALASGVDGTKIAGYVTAAVCAGALIVGVGFFSLFPTVVLGGIIVYMGGSLLAEWLWDSRRRMSPVDYAVVVAILLVVALFGVLPGVGVGTLASLVMFAVAYGRLVVVHRIFSGREVWSNIDRSAAERQILREQGDRICGFQLRGFLFFGTAYALYRAVRDRLGGPGGERIRYVILDVARVQGLDGSAEFAVTRILRALDRHKAFLIWAGAGAGGPIRDRLLRHPEISSEAFYADVDHALEWCENQIIQDSDVQRGLREISIQEVLSEISPDQLKGVRAIMEERRFEPGEYVIRQGDEAEELYLIVSGELSVFLEREGLDPVRLRTMRAGVVFGEIALYVQTPRSVSIAALTPTRCLTLSRTALSRLETTDPLLALAFQRYLIRLLSERLVDLNRTMQAMADV